MHPTTKCVLNERHISELTVGLAVEHIATAQGMCFVQDHVVAGVLLTKRDTFLEKDEFMQLVYSAVCPTRPGLKDGSNIEIPLPAIFKPKPLWTGKQVGHACFAQ